MSRTLAIRTPPFQVIEPGISEESIKLRDVLSWAHEHANEPLSLGWKRPLYDRAMEIGKRYSEASWDCYDAEPISSDAIARTLRLIYLLPESISPPELVPSPEGEISLEWNDVHKRIVSVTPRPNLILWAAMTSDQHSQYGKAPISDGWPNALLDVLSQYFPNVRFTSSRS
jgi:hypothetical protein